MKESKKKLIYTWISGFCFGISATLFLLIIISKLY